MSLSSTGRYALVSLTFRAKALASTADAAGTALQALALTARDTTRQVLGVAGTEATDTAVIFKGLPAGSVGLAADGQSFLALYGCVQFAAHYGRRRRGSKGDR